MAAALSPLVDCLFKHIRQCVSIDYIEVGHGPAISEHELKQNMRRWVGERWILAF